MPEPFLAIDGCLQIVVNVARGLVVYPKTIEAAVHGGAAVHGDRGDPDGRRAAGGDRQELHEVIRTHSLAAAAQVKQEGKPNDLIERLTGDAAFAGSISAT